MISQSNHKYNTRSTEDVTTFYCKRFIQIFLFSIYHSRMEQTWYTNKKIRIFLSFKDSFLKVGRATAKPIYNIHNPTDLKFLTRLTLGLSHLNEHEFKHNFQDCLNSLRSCSLEIESLSHFLRHCHHLINLRAALLDDL